MRPMFLQRFWWRLFERRSVDLDVDLDGPEDTARMDWMERQLRHRGYIQLRDTSSGMRAAIDKEMELS